MRALRPLCLLLATALTVSGCGGTYTKRDYIARASAICAAAVRQARLIAPPATGATSGMQRLQAIASYASEVLPIAETEASQLRALKRPSQGQRDAATLEHYLAALSAAVADYRQLALAAKQGDAQGVGNAGAALRASPAAALAAAYGLRSCSSPGSTAV